MEKVKDFDYDFVEIECGDAKIVFISDEKTDVVRPTDIHMHSFWELFYVESGKLTINAKDKSYALTDKQALLIPPQAYHHSLPEENTVKKSIFFTFEKIRAKDDECLFDKLYSLFLTCDFYKFDDNGKIIDLLNETIHNLKSRDSLNELRVKSKVSDLILHLYDNIAKEFTSIEEVKSEKTAYWVYKYEIDRLIDAYYSNDVSLDLLSEKLFISTQSIKRIIASVYGKSFNDLKLELKMRNAKKLLLETKMNVSEIAKETGYSTTRGFLTAFEKYEGCTPTEYRKR